MPGNPISVGLLGCATRQSGCARWRCHVTSLPFPPWPFREDRHPRHPRHPVPAPRVPHPRGRAPGEGPGFRRSPQRRRGRERSGGERVAAAAPAVFSVKVKHTHSLTRLPPKSFPCSPPSRSHRLCHSSGGILPRTTAPASHWASSRHSGGWEGFNRFCAASFPATFLIRTAHGVSPCLKPHAGSPCPMREHLEPS